MVNVGIIGAGRIGRVHVESICTQVSNAKVKTLADPFMTEDTAAWAKEMGVEKTTRDYKDILNDPQIDAVLICSSTDTHSTISVEAIEAGKHVFCEKPIDHDVKKIQEVVDALKKSNVKYQVGFNRRFDHNFEAVRDAVAAGKIGETQIIKVTSRDPEPPSADYVKVSGGMFLDMTIHDFDMVRFLAGCDAEEVYVEAAVLVDPAIGEAGDGEKPLYFFLERYMAAYAKEIKCFIDAIEKDTDTPLGVMDGLEPVLMGLAAKKSLEEHRPVKISEITV